MIGDKDDRARRNGFNIVDLYFLKIEAEYCAAIRFKRMIKEFFHVLSDVNSIGYFFMRTDSSRTIHLSAVGNLLLRPQPIDRNAHFLRDQHDPLSNETLV